MFRLPARGDPVGWHGMCYNVWQQEPGSPNPMSVSKCSTLAARLPAALAGALLLAGAGPAFAACTISFSGLANKSASNYDAYGADYFDTEPFLIAVDANDNCAFAIGAGNGNNASGSIRRMKLGSAYIPYEIYTTPSRTQRLGDATGPISGMITGATAGTSIDPQFEFAWTIPAGTLVPAGTYTDSVRFSLYQVVGGQPGTTKATQNVTFSAKVYATVGASLIIDGSTRDLQSGGTLDFGTLSAGLSKSFTLAVSGNTGYTVNLASENRSILKGPSGATVPYTAQVNGATASLTSASGITFTYASNQSHSVALTIGDVSRALAGTYQDNLILTVTSN